MRSPSAYPLPLSLFCYPPMLELHCHTTHSDGTLTPQALVDYAIAAGVTVLAITDHDTVSG